MDAIIFYLAVPFLYLLSMLPLRVLYLLSDILYPVTYYLIAYRRKIVFENLRNSFPDKNENEIRELARKFYRHFNDIIMEILKMTTISQKTLKKRLKFRKNRRLKEGDFLRLIWKHHMGVREILGIGKKSTRGRD